MKLLKAELEQIIKEEIDKFLNESAVRNLDEKLRAIDIPFINSFSEEEIAEIGPEKFKKLKDELAYKSKDPQYSLSPGPGVEKLVRSRARKKLFALKKDAEKKVAANMAADKQAKADYGAQVAKLDNYEREKALEPVVSGGPTMSMDPEKPTMSLEPQSREEKLADAGLSTDNPLGIPMMPTKGKSKSKKRPSSKAAKQNALSKRTGRSVASIQKMFKELFPKNSRSFRRGKPDGQYGGETEKVIKAVQAQLGIKQDGLWGPGTEKAWLAADAKTKSIASSGTTTQQTAQAVAKKPAVPLAKLQAAAEKAALDVRRMRLPGGGVPYGRPEYVAAKNKADQLAKVYQFALQKSKANKQVAGTPTPQ